MNLFHDRADLPRGLAVFLCREAERVYGLGYLARQLAIALQELGNL